MKKLATHAICASLFLMTPTLAANEGAAVGVRPDAIARQYGSDRVLVVGADVSVGESIVTGPTGNVQLLFDDQTRIVVGPRSTLQIETYLLNGSGADKFAINALAGTFRFISGTSPKPAYSIDTPTASIAVRGTKFDLTVGGGQSLTLLYEGALTQCENGICIDLESRCHIGVSGNGLAQTWTISDEERDELVKYFPLANIQSAFLAPFRVAGAQACLTPPSISPPRSLNTPQDRGSGNNTQTQTPTFTGPTFY